MKIERYRKEPEFRTVIKLTFDDEELQRSAPISAFFKATLGTAQHLLEMEGVDVDVTDHRRSELGRQRDDEGGAETVSEYGA